MTVVLGHQGGWDEILLFLGAFGVFYLIYFAVSWFQRRKGQAGEGTARRDGDHRARLEERRRINEQARRKDRDGSS